MTKDVVGVYHEGVPTVEVGGPRGRYLETPSEDTPRRRLEGLKLLKLKMRNEGVRIPTIDERLQRWKVMWTLKRKTER